MTSALRPARSAAGQRIAVIGAGWAGLAAAVRAVQAGAEVSVFEMAGQLGGRARQVRTRSGDFDNGQHILIGAYSHTLSLMRSVGADPESLLWRQPLVLAAPDGRGLRLPPGAPVPAFVRAVLTAQGWSWRDRLALLRAAARWRLQGFRCAAGQTVHELCAGLPQAVHRDLIDPLCVAALNTPSHAASAQVFIRVLQDALFAGPGSADLLLPRVPLSTLLPEPASHWLAAKGTRCLTGHRVQSLVRVGTAWQVDGQTFDAVVLACSATEAARLAGPINPTWATAAQRLQYQAIVTVYLEDHSLRLPHPMLALREGPEAPAQFVFDLGALGGAGVPTRWPQCAPSCAPAGANTSTPPNRHPAGQFAWVVSGAQAWLTDSLEACGRAVLQQARSTFAGAFQGPDVQVLRHLSAERRATFACTPALVRPTMQIAQRLLAAGDYIAGPYPATLEGAVRSGDAAAQAVLAALSRQQG